MPVTTLTETPSLDAAIPADIHQQISRIQTDLGGLRQELEQALDVWKTTLAEEKSQFEGLWQHKESAWQEQEAEWQRQREAYEQRITALQTEFEARLKQTEQNAVRSLNELDDAWQRDKLDWGPPARAEWATLRPALENRIQELERQLADSESARQAERVEASTRLRQLEEISEAESRVPLEAFKTQLAEVQDRMTLMQTHAPTSDALIEASLQTLDCQIQVLFDLVQLFDTPSSSPDNVPSVELR